MATAVAHGRRKSGSGHSTASSGSGMMGGGARAGRLDPGLKMSTRTDEDAGRPLAHASRNHKSSERLHRLGSRGASGTDLTKRSKSYSQIMNAAHTGAGKKKASSSSSQQKPAARRSKTDRDGEEDEEWTSSDQAATPADKGEASHVDSDSSEDEGLVLAAGKNRQKQSIAPSQAPEHAATAGQGAAAQDRQPVRQGFMQPPPIVRTETETTIRGAQDDARAKKQEGGSSPRNAEHAQTQAHAKEDDKAVPGTSTPTLELPQDETSVAGPSSLSAPANRQRTSSSASLRTLTGDRTNDSSLHSPKSMRSLRTRSALMPRESRHSVAPPKVTSAYAFAGERAPDESDDSYLTTSKSEARGMNHLGSFESAGHYRIGNHDSKRKSSISSARSSFINLVSASPSMALLSSQAASAEPSGSQGGSRAVEAMHRASSSGITLGTDKPRQRTRSWQGGNEAAKLASKLRMTSTDNADAPFRNIASGSNISEATRMLASSGSKYFSNVRSAGGDSATAKALTQYHKPTVSKFVKREEDFRANERSVTRGSLYDKHFARASMREGGQTTARTKGKGGKDAQVRQAKAQVTATDADDRVGEAPLVRYVMDYGLSGPAISSSPTAQALLSSCLDHDEFESSWAPALAQAAGLGVEDGVAGLHQRIASGANPYDGMPIDAGMDGMHGGAHIGSTSGFLINGPNATPLHFLHGLTNTDDSPFPLDALDIALPPAAAAAVENDAAQRQNLGNYFDAKNLRAVAQTWAALNAAKNHIMTRRYVDPMRESMERVGAASGMKLGRSASTASPAQAARANSLGLGGGLTTSRSAKSGLSLTTDAAMSHARRQGGASIANTGKRQSGTVLRSGTSTPSPAAGDARTSWGWRNLFSEQTST